MALWHRYGLWEIFDVIFFADCLIYTLLFYLFFYFFIFCLFIIILFLFYFILFFWYTFCEQNWLFTQNVGWDLKERKCSNMIHTFHSKEKYKTF